MSRLTKIIIALFCTGSVFAAEHPNIMVSIKPFYNICAKVMQSVANPGLLLQNNASPHDFQLKPSDLEKIAAADLVIWGGPDLEGFLSKPLANDASKDLNLSAVPGLHLLRLRDNHDHNDEHHHGVNDPHFWLDPDNAILIANAIAKRLAMIDPSHANIYQQNAKQFIADLKQKNLSWHQQLSGMKNKPYIVFHDAYQYLEKYFGLKNTGAISLHPEIPPSAKRVQDIKNLLTQNQVACIFAEPQFNPKIIDTVTEGSKVYRGQLDPLGQDTDLGPNGYVILIDKLVAGFAACAQSRS